MHVHTLESRRFMSVAVTEGYPGFFEINGDEDSNMIAVSVSMADSTFTLNGVTYAGAAYLTVNGNGGDDSISVIATDGRGYVGATLKGGNGNDNLTLNFDGAIWGGNGKDSIQLYDSLRGEAYGEGGDDAIEIGGSCLSPQVNGGDGNDTIRASSNQYAVTLRGGNGDDVLFGSMGDDQLYGGAGNDILCGLSGRDVFYSGDGSRDRIFGGDGNDTLYGDEVEEGILGVEYVFVVDYLLTGIQ